MSKELLLKCLIVDDEPLARSIIIDHIAKVDFLKIAGECKNALEANTFLLKQNVDIIFLDINMPHLSGIDFAKQLNPKPAIIFTTAYAEFALDGFELDAIDYLMKPIDFNRFFKAANKALKWLGKEAKPEPFKNESKENTNEAFVYLKAEDKMIRLELKNIIAIESQGHYVRIYTIEKNFIIHQSITDMENRLPKSRFMRTHRSFIASLSHIQAYSATFIETEKIKIPIGRSYKNEVLSLLRDN